MIRAGELRHRITIQQPDDSAAAWGGERTWHTYVTVWAKITPKRGRYNTSEDIRKDEAEVTHEITIRYIRGLNPSMRATFEGRIFKFRAPINVDEKNRGIIINAIEEID